MKIKKLFSPALVLFLLAPTIGELLSGSAPPAEFFAPVGFILLAVLYGGGAILARELMHRWRKGWPTLLLLGAAYGIIEEGLMVKSFFDPHWMDLDVLAFYGRWDGVNWIWSLLLTVYHAVFSIAIPILLVSLMFPERRGQPWVSRRGFQVLSALFVLDGLLIFFLLTLYRPPAILYLLAVGATLGLGLLARWVPHPLFPQNDKPAARARWFGLVGFFGTLGLFFCGGALPHTLIPAPVTLFLMAGWVLLVALVLVRMSGRGPGWPGRHLLALASGALGFFILLSPLQELDQARPDSTAGMSLVGLAAILFLAWIARRIHKSY